MAAPTDAEVIRALTDLRKRIFCHGTTSKALEGMRRCGLTPRDTNGCRASIWEGEKESRLGRVYLSDLPRVKFETGEPVDRTSLRSIEGRQTAGMFSGAICFGSAEQAVKAHGGQEVILEVSGKALDRSKLAPDEDMEKAFDAKMSKGWIDYMESKAGKLTYLKQGYRMTEEERQMSIALATCEWVLAGANEFRPDRIRKVVDILRYDAHPALWNLHYDTNVPSIGPEDVKLLRRLREQEPSKAKAQIRRVCKKLPPWYLSLLTIGTVATKGRVPEEHIKVRFARPPKEVEDELRKTQKLWGLFDSYIDSRGIPLKEWHKRSQKYILREKR